MTRILSRTLLLGILAFAITFAAGGLVLHPPDSEAFHTGWLAGPNLLNPHGAGSAFVVSSAAGDHIYVAGGTASSGVAHANVERAQILTDGTLGPFQTMSPLPAPRLGGAVLVDQDRVFFFGGWDNGSSSQASQTVFRAPIDGSTGVVGPWEIIPAATSQLAMKTSWAGVFSHQGRIYLVGGTCNSAGSGCPSGASATWNTVQSASIVSPGVLSQFSVEADLLTQRVAPGQHTVVVGNHVYNFGGLTPSPQETSNVIERAELLGGGGIGPWSAVGTLPHHTGLGGVANVGVEIAVIGGYQGSPQISHDQVLEAPTSTPASLAPGVPLPLGRHFFTLAAHNGRAYILSGSELFGPATAGTLISDVPVPIDDDDFDDDGIENDLDDDDDNDGIPDDRDSDDDNDGINDALD